MREFKVNEYITVNGVKIQVWKEKSDLSNKNFLLIHRSYNKNAHQYYIDLLHIRYPIWLK